MATEVEAAEGDLAAAHFESALVDQDHIVRGRRWFTVKRGQEGADFSFVGTTFEAADVFEEEFLGGVGTDLGPVGIVGEFSSGFAPFFINKDKITSRDMAPKIAGHGPGGSICQSSVELVKAEDAIGVFEPQGGEELVGERRVGRSAFDASGGEVEAASLLQGLSGLGGAIGGFFPGWGDAVVAAVLGAEGAGITGVEGEEDVLAGNVADEFFEQGMADPGVVEGVFAEAVFGDDGASASFPVLAMGGDVDEELVVGVVAFLLVGSEFIEDLGSGGVVEQIGLEVVVGA